jgi:hypothetical protein
MDKLASLYRDHIAAVKKRHDRALAATGYDAVIIFAGALRYQFLDDNSYPFKVNPHFKQWVPVVDNPQCFVVYTPGEKPKLVFYQPVDYWYKPAETPRGWWVDQFDISVITDPDQAKQYFPRGRQTALIGEWSDPFEGKINPEPLLNHLHWERSWKTDYEIECMRIANISGARGHRAAERAFREGQSEYEIHLAYLRAATGDRGGNVGVAAARRRVATQRCCRSRASSDAGRPIIRRGRASASVRAVDVVEQEGERSAAGNVDGVDCATSGDVAAALRRQSDGLKPVATPIVAADTRVSVATGFSPSIH